MEHTPGPWQVGSETYPIAILSGHRHGSPDNEVICIIGDDPMTPEDDDECKANARLIAAAPDLLAALTHIMGNLLAPRDNDEIREGSYTAHWHAAVAAIAKAGGRAS